MIGQSIPGFLWPEVFFSIIQITNRTATVSLNNITLYEEFMNSVDPGRDHKPYLGHLYVLGCKTYVLIPPEDRKRSRKLDARAEIGILVGYKGEHIYRVWIPGSSGQGRIVRTSHVRFDEGGLITDPADDSLDHQDTEIPIEIRGKDVQQSRQDLTTDQDLIDQDHADDPTDRHKVEFDDTASQDSHNHNDLASDTIEVLP